jgi:PAP2 superfamily
MDKIFYSLALRINHFRHTNIKLFTTLLLCVMFQCKLSAQHREAQLRPFVKNAIFALSNVMMHDVVSPVIASRYYMYSTIGANAILANTKSSIIHPSKYIFHFPSSIGKHQLKDPSLAALFSIYETGMAILPSGANMKDEYESLIERVASIGYKSTEVSEARIVAAETAKEILKYAAQDGYSKLSAFPKYRPKRKDGYWFPTPPAYMDAVDPYWRTMRTMIIDSSNQFRGKSPMPFDTTSGSLFNKLVNEVYQIGKSPTTEQKEIAAFWDCNPFVVATSGHMSLGFKKISPGGHWMNITCIAAISHQLPYDQMIQSLSIVAIGLYDAFIVCWNEKYTTDRARPETIINKFIDVKWQPLLQTPPFPEYTSGHSVISSATAEILSFLIGEKVSFVDDSEIIFELPPRKFNSFRHAAEEASVSRLYGGIHYRDAIENGQDQGKKVGKFIIEKIQKAGLKK